MLASFRSPDSESANPTSVMWRPRISALLACGAALAFGVFAVRAQRTGTTLWSTPLGHVVQSSVALGCDNGRIYKLARDRAVRWFFPTGGSVIGTPAVGPDGIIYAASVDGCLYALDAEGTEKFRLSTGDAITGSPAIDASGVIYFGTSQGNPFAVFPDGRVAWGLHTGGSVVSSPAVAEDGTIYVGLLNNKLLAVAPVGLKNWEFTAGGRINSSPAIGACTPSARTARASGPFSPATGCAPRPRSARTAPSSSAPTTPSSTRSARTARRGGSWKRRRT